MLCRKVTVLRQARQSLGQDSISKKFLLGSALPLLTTKTSLAIEIPKMSRRRLTESTQQSSASYRRPRSCIQLLIIATCKSHLTTAEQGKSGEIQALGNSAFPADAGADGIPDLHACDGNQPQLGPPLRRGYEERTQSGLHHLLPNQMLWFLNPPVTAGCGAPLSANSNEISCSRLAHFP